MEAAPRIELGMKVLQTSALPLGYAAVWSGKRGSNSRPPPWQGGALPLSYFRMKALPIMPHSRFSVKFFLLPPPVHDDCISECLFIIASLPLPVKFFFSPCRRVLSKKTTAATTCDRRGRRSCTPNRPKKPSLDRRKEEKRRLFRPLPPLYAHITATFL